MMMKCLAALVGLMTVFAFTVTQQKNIFEKKEILTVKYAVAVMPGAFPKSYGYFNKAFKFQNIDPLGLSFLQTDSTDLVLTEKILEEQIGTYLDSKKIQMPGGVSNTQVYARIKTFAHQAMTLSAKDGKHYICLNLFCEVEKYADRWLSNWIEVKDGGTCFWHIIISLNDKKLLFAHPNGEA